MYGFFVSRKNGWANGDPIRYYHSQIHEYPEIYNSVQKDILNEKNGTQIIQIIETQIKNYNNEFIFLLNEAKKYPNWYFYWKKNNFYISDSQSL